MKIVLILLIVFVYGCSTEDVASGPMEGTPTNVQLRGMKEMCEREPDAEVCNAD